MKYKDKELENRDGQWYIKGTNTKVMKDNKPLVQAFREAVDGYKKPKNKKEPKNTEPEKVVFKGGITPNADYHMEE